MTNCPNCGAVIDLTTEKCEYCGTPYLLKEKGESKIIKEPISVRIDHRQLAACATDEIISPNEVRRLLGLPRL